MHWHCFARWRTHKFTNAKRSFVLAFNRNVNWILKFAVKLWTNYFGCVLVCLYKCMFAWPNARWTKESKSKYRSDIASCRCRCPFPFPSPFPFPKPSKFFMSLHQFDCVYKQISAWDLQRMSIRASKLNRWPRWIDQNERENWPNSIQFLHRVS